MVVFDALDQPPLAAFDPRPQVTPIPRAEALAQLSIELESVALRASAAIARAWDTRRLGYGNEGRHPFELEVAALLGLNGGYAREYVAAMRERELAHAQGMTADPRWRAPGSPIGRLMSELKLSPRAVDIMMVVAAPALRGEVARLYGILANDEGRPCVDELLVHQVLEEQHDRHDLAIELDAAAPLFRLGVVHVARKRARPFAELSVDPEILARLRAVAPVLGDGVSVRRADRTLAELDVPHDVLVEAFAALAHPPAGAARVLVRARAGCGRKTLLATLVARANRELAVIDCRALPRQPDLFVAGVRRALRVAHLNGLVPCLAHLEELTFGEQAARDVVGEVLRVHPGPIAAALPPDAASPFTAGQITITLPVGDETARRAAWRHALDGAGLAADADLLAARYRTGPGIIRRAVATVAEKVAHEGSLAVLPERADATPALDRTIRETRDLRLGQHARRVDRLASWDDVALPADVNDSVRELIARVRHRRTVLETWGMDKTLLTSRGLTALFQGPPGTGKTMVAGVIARELGLDLYQIDLSKVMSKWLGETERNLSAIFDAADQGQVVLLFDEADALFAKRTEVRTANDRYANLEVDYLLQRLDAFEGIAILTTNHGGSIDQAFKRRMSFRLTFPLPDEETRARLWRAHLPPELPSQGPLMLDVLARKYQLSGGYIRKLCLRAAFLAAGEGAILEQRHLERAVALETADTGKLSTSGPIG